jgi:hypothetical protein
MSDYGFKNILLTTLPFFLTMSHQVQFTLPKRESRENRERSRLCNQGRTLQNVTARETLREGAVSRVI